MTTQRAELMHDDDGVSWPEKTCELRNQFMDSTRWDGFEFREGDVVIATCMKSGTTWVQQIVGQLIFNGAENMPVMDICPWVDLRILPEDEMFQALDAQKHRRFMKTHLPVNSLLFSQKARYIYIGRDGRDALWSWHNHHASLNDTAYRAFNGTPGRVGPPLDEPKDDIVEYFHDWLDNDGYPIWPFFSNVQSWWDIRNLRNVMLLHFDDLKADLEGSIRRIANFLGITIDTELWPTIVEHCTFAYMKEHADSLTPGLEQMLDGGGKSFIYKGTNGRWRDVLSGADIRKYDEVAARGLSADCAKWLAGETAAF